jgi:TonB family protein
MRTLIFIACCLLLSSYLFGQKVGPPSTDLKDTIEETLGATSVAPKPKIDLYQFFSTHLQYPDSALKNGIEGIVNVKCVVTREGNIVNVAISKGLKNGYGLNEEAVRLVSALPNGSFTPGESNGRPVSVYIFIPLKFTIK